MNDLAALIGRKKIVVCVGTGGVGKTTLSAVIALHEALAGRKTLVLTIDPARRLANSLGLASLGNRETRVPEQKFVEAGLRPAGSLYAMMLDTKTTFDDLVRKAAPSEDVAARILENHFYQNLSTAMAGSHEYLAMEKLYALYRQGNYDTIVLDTPPTRQALDFLDAPRKVSAFLDKDVLRWFLKPTFAMGRGGLKLLNTTGSAVFRVIERITGAEFMKDVSDFFLGFNDVFDDFRQEADEVFQVLRGPDVTFLMVMGPSRMPLQEARFFYEKLSEYRMPFSGFIINRMHPDYLLGCLDREAGAGAQAPDRAALLENLDREARERFGELAPVLLDIFGKVQTLAEIDRDRIREFLGSLDREVPHWTLPLLDEDVFDLAGLARLGRCLFSGSSCNPSQ